MKIPKFQIPNVSENIEKWMNWLYEKKVFHIAIGIIALIFLFGLCAKK